MLHSCLLIIVGFILLTKGGDYLINGAVAIARRVHLSAMVIGLTVVAFGTSAPELLVSLKAALQGSSGIAIGNVVGSNIANIALILGVTATLSVVPAKKMTLTVDMPFLLLASILMAVAALSGTIQRWHGIVGLCMLVGFITWQIRNTRRQHNQAKNVDGTPADENVVDAETTDSKPMSWWMALMVIVVSCAALSFGADFLIDGASNIARTVGQRMNIPTDTMERIIGLTIVAIGTSLPELFASVSAARQGKTDMAIGNVIGSNIFNILCVVSASAAITPITNSAAGFQTDYACMIVLTAILWLFLYTGRKLSHQEGIALLTMYACFIIFTLLTH